MSSTTPTTTAAAVASGGGAKSALPAAQQSPAVRSLLAKTGGSPKLHLYTASTPNGYKPSILLEELLLAYPDNAELAYDYRALSFDAADQKNPEFLQVNPNGRIPALVDEHVPYEAGKAGHVDLPREGVRGLRVWESASVLLHLVDRYDRDRRFWFDDAAERAEALSVLFWIHGGIGPMQGQSNHFYRYAPEKIPYGIKRYRAETERLYGVFNALLEKSGEYLVGNKYSIVDISAYGWVSRYWWAGASVDHAPLVSAWIDRLAARPGVDRGVAIPTRAKSREELEGDKGDEEARKNSKWIMEGQK